MLCRRRAGPMNKLPLRPSGIKTSVHRFIGAWGHGGMRPRGHLIPQSRIEALSRVVFRPRSVSRPALLCPPRAVSHPALAQRLRRCSRGLWHPSSRGARGSYPTLWPPRHPCSAFARTQVGRSQAFGIASSVKSAELQSQGSRTPNRHAEPSQMVPCPARHRPTHRFTPPMALPETASNYNPVISKIRVVTGIHGGRQPQEHPRFVDCLNLL